MKEYYNKLVRDRIPEIIDQSGKKVQTKQLAKSEFKVALEAKLREEVEEYLEAKTKEELADILEVLYALAAADGIERDELERISEEKRERNGAFEQRVFLISVEGI